MAVKKYLSLDRLTEYDALIKQEFDSKIAAVNTSITNITNGDIVVKEAEHAESANSATNASNASNADKLGGLQASEYAKISDIPTGALADKDVVSESDLDSALAEKVNAAAEGNHSHSNKSVLDGITSAKVSSWDSAEANAKAYADTGLDKKVDKVTGKGLSTNDYTTTEKNKLSGIEAGAQVNTVTGVKGNSESSYRTGNINITKANIGLGNVDNTADADKNVKYATSAGSATSANSATKATQDASGNVITSTYETKTDASSKLASANKYTDDKIALLMNNSSEAVDSIMELKSAMENNADAIEALNDIAAGKAPATHGHEIADVNGLQSALDGKAASSHGTHVTWSTTTPKVNGTAAVGTEAKVARGDHVHPTDTSRASKTEFDAHTGDAVKHIASTERTNWGTAYTHSQADHAPVNAQANVIESIKVNGTALTISSKAVNITVPTNNNQLTNGAGYITSSAISNKADKATTLSGYGITNAYTKTEVDSALSGKSATGHGHDAATTSAAGFMTAAMVTKLNGIATGATKVTVDSALSDSSTNPVQNKIVNNAIVTATNAITANTNSINAHSTAIGELQTAVAEFVEITSVEIQNLFK